MPAGRPKITDAEIRAALPGTVAVVSTRCGLRDLPYLRARLRNIPGVVCESGVWCEPYLSATPPTVTVSIPLSAIRDAMEGRR